MKVGIHYTLRNPSRPGWFRPWPEYYAAALDHVAEMDRLGFNSVNFAEHHFDPDGYNPAPIVTVTAAALRTTNCRVGQNILQLPYHHPVRVAEDIATIDILSGGRVTLNVGGGAFDDEARAFGIDPRFRHSRTTEGIDIIRRCWTEDVFSYEGKRFQLQDVRVYPKPLQQPHPPIYVTANSDSAIERAARMGLNVCAPGGGMQAGLGNTAQWQTWSAKWRAALATYGRQPGELKTNSFGTCFVTDDPEREWAKHREAIFYTSTYKRHNGRQPYLGMHGGGRFEKPEDLPGWRTFFRTPEDTVRHMRETFADGGLDELLIYGDRPGIRFEDTVPYLQAFAEKVLPKIADL